MRILYVEDHPDTATAMKMLLQFLGHDPLIVTNQTSAGEALASERVDAVMCDFELPDGDGCDFVKNIASKYRIPCIAVTGHVYDTDRERAERSGFDAFLAKPVVIEDLERILGLIQKRHRLPIVA